MFKLLFIFQLSVYLAEARVFKTSTSISVISMPAPPPNSISNMQPGQWFKISNSPMRSAVTTVGQGNVASVMNAWSGGAFDAKRNRLIVFGGGHSDYSGNEVYAFDIPTLKWLRLTAPSASPVSVHTYNQLEYLPKQDVLVSFGGATWPNGNASGETWLLNLSTNSWSQGPSMPGTAYSLWNFNMTSAYDPVSDQLLVAGYSQSAGFNGSSKSWKLYGDADRNLYETGTFDTKRRKFFKFGGGIHVRFDVDMSGVMGNQTPISTTGDKTIENCTNPGLQFEPKADRIIGWCGGSDIFSFNPDTNVWSKHPAKAGVGPQLPAGYTGTFGRFRYVPAYNVFVVVTSIDDDVYIYKFSDSLGKF